MSDGPEQQPDSVDKSLGDQATGADVSRVDRDMSLGDQSTSGDALSSISDLTDLSEDLGDEMPIVDLSERYEIEQSIGKGGMGEVVRATDRRLDRPVAIKRLRQELAASRKAAQRFLTEAKSIAALNHFNIVQIYDYGRDADGPFIIMELVEGKSLQDKLRDGKLELAEAIDLTCQLCDGLAVAHEQGIIHRDIKPANILLTKRGEPKLTDFGLARQETTDSEQTKAGVVIGTLDFMSPEQRRDATATDARSDLWSLAATLYQMVTGKSPKVIRLDQVGESLRNVLGQALEEDPSERFQDSASFREALKRALAKQQTATQSLAEDELVEGCCGKCGVVNDLDRKFCKSCAAPLRETCLACEAENAAWERICGECGSNLPELVAARRKEIISQKGVVESLRRQYRYEEAIDQLRSLLVGDHPRFSTENAWIEETVRSLKSEHQQQRKRCQPIVDQGREDLSNLKFAEAIKLLQAIPAALRDREILDLLKQSQSNQQEIERLAKEIKEQIAAKEITGLLEKANRFLELAPGHPQIMKLQGQLLSRQKKVASQGTAVLERAEKLYSEYQDEDVLKVLSHWPSGLQQPARAVQLQQLARKRLASAPQPIDLGSIPLEMPAARNRPAIILPGKRRGKPTWQQPWVLATAGAGVVVLIVLIVLLNSGGDQSSPGDKPELADKQNGTVTSGQDEDRQAKIAADKVAADKVAADSEAERLAADKAAADKAAADKAAADKAAADKAAADKAAADREAERLAVAKAAAEKATWVDLFDGRDMDHWASMDGGAAEWTVRNGYVEVAMSKGSVRTKHEFGPDLHLQLEFWVPLMPDKRGQARGNSGIYLLGRHEIQILDSFGIVGEPEKACGALWGVIGPSENRCAAPETWQTLDITYRSPRYDNRGQIRGPGRISVVLNRATVIDDAEFNVISTKAAPYSTPGNRGPIVLQTHVAPVRFRNIRVRELSTAENKTYNLSPSVKPPTEKTVSAKPPPPYPADAVEFRGHRYKVFQEQLSWREAKARCISMGGHLPIVTSKQENDFLTQLALKTLRTHERFDGIWLGATDEVQEGKWVGVNGIQMTYHNWFAKQPNNKQQAEHYLLLWLAENSWVDQPNVSNQHRTFFACEWDNVSKPSVGTDKWRELFNGRDLTGWSVGYQPGTKEKSPKRWVADESSGVIRAVGGDHDYLITDDQFADFTLDLEWKFRPGYEGSGNGSGVILHSTGQMADLDPDGVEIELMARSLAQIETWRLTARQNGGAGMIGTGCFLAYGISATNHSGSANGLSGANNRRHLDWLQPPPITSIHVWNRLSITATDDRVQVRINGKLVNEAWNLSRRSGRICLRSQDAAVEFRNIRIREVAETTNAPAEPSGVVPTKKLPAIPLYPADAVEFQGHRYKVFQEQLSWREAKARCISMGGHLPIVTSKQENDFLTHLALKTLRAYERRDGIWLGATDEVQEGKWLWLDGSPVTFNVWGVKQPNNKQQAEHYLMLYLTANNWSDQPNVSKQHRTFFACEWDNVSKASAGTDKWRELFNGRDLTGWHGDTRYWSVFNGELVGRSPGGLPRGQYLVCKKLFGDFEMQFQFLLKQGNSGVQFRSRDWGSDGVKGHQADIAYDTFKWLGCLVGERIGNAQILMTTPVQANRLRQKIDINGWNTMTLKAVGSHVTITINGETTVADNVPDMRRSGVIALQLHGGAATEIRFRQLNLRDLSD